MLKLLQLLRDDLRTLQPRLRLVNLLIGLMPGATLSWLRPLCYRWAGMRVGLRGRILGKITLTGDGPIAAHVRIGDDCFLTTPLFLNASAPISIGNRVMIGHHATIITDSHDHGDPQQRGGKRHSLPITIEDGVWIAAQVTILPGVTLGRGSVIAAGALVVQDVPPDTMVGGVPARVLKRMGTAQGVAAA